MGARARRARRADRDAAVPDARGYLGRSGLLLARVASDRAVDQHQYGRCRRQCQLDDHRIARACTHAHQDFSAQLRRRTRGARARMSSSGPMRKSAPARQDAQAFLTQAVHQPLALTSLPPNMLQGPSAAPALPENKLQLLQTAVLSVRLGALVASIL